MLLSVADHHTASGARIRMPKVSFASIETAPVIEPPADAKGSIETRAIFGRDSDRIQLYLHRLGPGSSVQFNGHPADRLIYVWEGSLEAGGSRLTPRSSAILEYRTTLTTTAGELGASVLAFGLKERGPQERSGGHVHLLPSERVPRIDTVQGKRIGMALHADSQCPTCKLWFHENDYFSADEETAVHSHSEDEIIFVRAGSIRLGNRIRGAGTALAIAANTKYGFFSGPDGLSFVNFRGTSPTYTSGDGSVVLDEAQLWRSHVGKPEYLQPH
jgi:hypothetical protein